MEVLGWQSSPSFTDVHVALATGVKHQAQGPGRDVGSAAGLVLSTPARFPFLDCWSWLCGSFVV